MTMTMTITTTETLFGHAAIDYADDNGLALNKHADPTEGARTGLAVGAAREVAAEDPSLIWLDVITDGQVTALREEAGTHGDEVQVRICTAALAGDPTARAECADVIREARLA